MLFNLICKTAAPRNLEGMTVRFINALHEQKTI